jgi:hypothetical protein
MYDIPSVATQNREIEMATHNERRRIIVHLVQHKTTGLIAAVSDDLYGLVVHGHSEEEIRRKLPEAIKDLVSAQGNEVLSLDLEEDNRMSWLHRERRSRASLIVTPAEYWAAIERIPLRQDRETSDGEAYICRDANNQPVRVTKPENLTDAERVVTVEFYRLFYAPTRH